MRRGWRHWAAIGLLLTCLAQPLQAEESALHTWLIAANIADIVSTQVALQQPGIVETNPLVRTVGLYPMKVGATAAEIYLVHKMWASGQRKSAIIATCIIVGINVGLTYNNLRHAGAF